MNLKLTGELSDYTDEQLLAFFLQGEEEAFTLLANRYARELFHFLQRFTNDPATSDDLFQETLLQIHQSAETFDPTRKFKPWVFTIAANKARDHLRKASRRRTVSLDAAVSSGSGDEGRTFIDLMESDIALPLDEIELAESKQMVQEVVAAMPDHLREVLLLAYFHRFSYKRIAEMLDVPLGTVKSRLHAAVAACVKAAHERFD